MPGRFVDEFYTEDDEEADRLADEEALRAARMLGLLVLVCAILGAIAGGYGVWRMIFG